MNFLTLRSAMLRRGLRASASVAAPVDPGDPVLASYTEDTSTDFINPERGWMVRAERDETLYVNARAGDSDVPFGYSILWTPTFGTPWNGSVGENPFRLDNYRTANIPASLLTELEAYFADARTYGIKLKLRFMYNYSDPGNDATLAWILTHIGQLAPTLNANRDVVASLDAGFLGAYGEWAWDTSGSSYPQPYCVEGLSGGANNLDWWTEPYLTVYRDVIARLLDQIHSEIHIGMRYPRQDKGIRVIYPGTDEWKMPLSQRFQEATYPQARVGWLNDSFVANQGNGGAYDFDNSPERGDLDRATNAWVGQYTHTGGESSAVGGLNSYNDGANVIIECAYMNGPDVLHRKFYTPIIDKWIDSGHYDEISRRLGYRLVLEDGEAPSQVTAGASMTLKLGIKNVGFGKVYKPRPLDLVFVGSGGPFTARMTSDARLDLPLGGTTVNAEWTFNAPTGLQASAAYALHLRLPDPATALASDNRYAIRLANTSIWDAATGRHNLGLSVTASA